MRKDLIFGDREAEFLRELVRQGVDFMIVGLSAAALQGAPVVTQDVDLWFRDLANPGIKRALRKIGCSYIPPIQAHPPMFEGDAVRLFDIVMHMHGLKSFADEEKNTVKVPLGRTKVKALRLDRIIASKRAAGRDKDKLVLPVLLDALRTIGAGTGDVA